MFGPYRPPPLALLPMLVLGFVTLLPSRAVEAPAPYLLGAEGVQVLGPEVLRERPGRFPFAVGERLDYDVSWWGIDVGRARLEVQRLITWRGLRLAHLVATARTNDFFSLIYPIDDRSEAWVDIDALRTVRTATLTRHSSKETWEEAEFDWETHLVHVVEEKRHAVRIKERVLDTGPFLYDTFDVFYALRTLPLSPGLSASLPVYASRKIYALHIDVEGIEEIESEGLGPTRAYRLRPYDLLDGKPANDGAGEVWVAATAPHVPIRLRGWFRTVGERLKVGGARVELAAYRAAAPGWGVPVFHTADAREWPGRTKEGKPIWEVPEEVQQARRVRSVEPTKRQVEGVLATPTSCPDPEEARRWARLALAREPCTPS